MLHTAAVLRQMQVRFTASRVFIVGLSLGPEECQLDVAAPLNPCYEPAEPFGIRTVPIPKQSQTAKWLRVCGLYVLCTTALIEALARLTKVETVDHLVEGGSAIVPDLMLGPPVTPAPAQALAAKFAVAMDAFKADMAVKRAAAPPVEDSFPDLAPPDARGFCGCGDSLCVHGHCATCDAQGLACGECASGAYRGDR